MKKFDLARLGDFISIKHGYAFKSEYFSKKPSNVILLTPGNFHREQYLYFGSNTKYYVGDIPSEYILNNNDLVVVMTDLTKEMNILGNAVIIESPKTILHNQRIGKVQIHAPGKLLKHYLLYLLNSQEVRRPIKVTASGTTVRHTSPKRILAVKVPVPPLEEQRKIADILGACDEAITLTERLIEAKQKYKKGLMQQLLTGKMRFPGFEGEWKTGLIGDVAKVRRGASPRPIKDPKWFSENGRGWVRIADVTKTQSRFLNETTQYLSPLGEKRSVPVDPGDLIMSIAATIGVPKIANIPACIHDGFVTFSEYEAQVDREFFYYALSFLTDKLSNRGQPGTQKNLNTKLVRQISIPLIPLEEQKRIAQLLNTCDEEITLLQRKAAALRQQKKGLMQQLLTGKVRVKG